MTRADDVDDLRTLRTERGWSQREVSDQLVRLAWRLRRERIGVNADMVAKWERGEKTPSRRYRELLGSLFEPNWSHRHAGAAAMWPSQGPAAIELQQQTLVDSMDGVLSFLDELGSAAGVLQPRIINVWRDEVIRRRVLLKLAALAPAAALHSASVEQEPVRPSREVVDRLDDLAVRYRSLYHSIAPATLVTPVMAHLETLTDLLGQKMTPAMRRHLFANKADVATIAGRLAFFDLSNSLGGRSYFHLALESAISAGDHLRAAAALGHMAFVPASERNLDTALGYLSAAEGHLLKQPYGPLRSWLAAVEAEIQANAGSAAAAEDAVDRARTALGIGGFEEPPWFDYYDSVRLAGFAGYVSLRAGRFDEARKSLDEALNRLPRHAVKQRAVYLCDYATVQLHDGELDDACEAAGTAIDQLNRAGYATGSERLTGFRAALAPWSNSPAVRLLDDQLAAVA